MANEDKFSKSIDDDQLDQVAGGTTQEMQKDIKFLNAIGKDFGIDLEEEPPRYYVIKAWEKIMGAEDVSLCTVDENSYIKNGERISRQEAMIEAMRKTGKFVDLDQYL